MVCTLVTPTTDHTHLVIHCSEDGTVTSSVKGLSVALLVSLEQGVQQRGHLGMREAMDPTESDEGSPLHALLNSLTHDVAVLKESVAAMRSP